MDFHFVVLWHLVRQILPLQCTQWIPKEPLWENEILHSVVFPYGLCQPGNYTVAANGTV